MMAPDTGLTDTISAKVRMTGVMMSPAQMYAMTHPSEPEMPISSPDVTKSPIPIVPENAIPFGHEISFYQDIGRYCVVWGVHAHQRCGDVRALCRAGPCGIAAERVALPCSPYRSVHLDLSGLRAYSRDSRDSPVPFHS